MCYSFACYCKDKVILEISLSFVGYENIIYVFPILAYGFKIKLLLPQCNFTSYT